MRIINFRYLLLDKNDLFKRYLNVEKCQLGYNSLANIKRTANLTIESADDIDFNNDRIQILCSIDGVEKSLGKLIMSSSKKVYGSYTRDIECFDMLLILQESKLKERLTISAGSNIINEIIKQFQGEKHKLNLQSYQTKADVDFEIGTSRLEVINYLLKIINYESLHTDEEGYFISNSYILPADRKVEIIYNDTSRDKNCIILPETEEEFDLFNVPNVFVRATNNSQVAPLRAVYVNNNTKSPSSIINRGREIVDFQTVDDVLDYQTLYDIAKRDAISSSNIYKHITLKTGINNNHGYMNCVRLNVKEYKINEIFIETSWSIDDCNPGGVMTHTLRRLVNV